MTKRKNTELIKQAIGQIESGTSTIWTAANLSTPMYMTSAQWELAVHIERNSWEREQNDKNVLAAFILMSEGYDLDELFDLLSASN